MAMPFLAGAQPSRGFAARITSGAISRTLEPCRYMPDDGCSLAKCRIFVGS